MQRQCPPPSFCSPCSLCRAVTCSFTRSASRGERSNHDNKKEWITSLLIFQDPSPPLFPHFRSSDLSCNPVGSRHLNSFRRRHSSPPERIAEAYGTRRRCIITPLHLFPPMKLHCKDTIPKIWNKYFQKRNCAATVPISTFVCVGTIYIFPKSVCLFCCMKICGPILGIYKSLTDPWMWKLGMRPRNSFSENT